MADYKLREPIDVQKGSSITVRTADTSSGFVVLFDADSAADTELRDGLLSWWQKSTRARVFAKLAEAHAANARSIEVTPQFTGKLYVLDVYDAEPPGPGALQAILPRLLPRPHQPGRTPGDDQQPGPVIIRGFPPRPRRDKFGVVDVIRDTVIDDFGIQIGELAQRVGVANLGGSRRT